jgi:hypothetical protein
MARFIYRKNKKRQSDIIVIPTSNIHQRTLSNESVAKVALAEHFQKYQVTSASREHPLHMNRNSKYKPLPPIPTTPTKSENSSIRITKPEHRRSRTKSMVRQERPRILTVVVPPDRSSSVSQHLTLKSGRVSEDPELFIQQPTEGEVEQRPVTYASPTVWKWRCNCTYYLSMKDKNKNCLQVDLTAASSKQYKAYAPEFEPPGSPRTKMFPMEVHSFFAMPVTPGVFSIPEVVSVCIPVEPSCFDFETAARMNYERLVKAPHKEASADAVNHILEVPNEPLDSIHELEPSVVEGFQELQGSPVFLSNRRPASLDSIELPRFEFEDPYEPTVSDSCSESRSIASDFSQICEKAFAHSFANSSTESNELQEDSNFYREDKYTETRDLPRSRNENPNEASLFEFPWAFDIETEIPSEGVDDSSHRQASGPTEPSSPTWTQSDFVKALCNSKGKEQMSFDNCITLGESARGRRKRFRSSYAGRVRREAWQECQAMPRITY